VTALAPINSESSIGIASLPGELTLTSYRPPDGLTFEQWEEIGRTLSSIGKAVQWWIGDWIRYGEREYGEKYTQALDETGYDYQTLRNMVYVAERVDLSRRRDNLSWTHHAEIASLPPEQQEVWLNRAQSKELSTRELRASLREVKLASPPAVLRLTFELPRKAIEALKIICKSLDCSDDEAVARALVNYAADCEDGNV
jgi:hypothetical protein